MSAVGDIFSGAFESVKKSAGDVVKTGAPAFLASIEQYGAQQLQGMANINLNTAQTNMNTIMNAPSTSAFGQTMSGVLSTVGTNAFFKNYGTQILIGAAVILVIGYTLK